MKKLIIIFLSLSPVVVFSQTFKGDFGIGGMAGGGYNNTEYGKYFSIGIAPEAGYFLLNNFLVGTQLGYSYFYDEYEIYPSTPETTHRHYISFGPLLRYYAPVSPKWRGILHLGYNWSWNIRDDRDSKYSEYLAGLGIGHFIAENVAVEGMFYHQKEQGVRFRAGFQVYIVRKKTGE